MDITVISDTHFGHNKLVEKGYRPDGFEDLILTNLALSKGDILIHLGDFAFYNLPDWVTEYMIAASGFTRHFLIQGNHDRKSMSWFYDRGFDLVCKELSLDVFGKIVNFSHIPNGKECNVHGHLHEGNHRASEEDILMSLERTNYKPLTLRKLLGK